MKGAGACAPTSVRFKTHGKAKTCLTSTPRPGARVSTALPTASGEPMRREKGFTLLELMVVMAIIATLMTIALPRYFTSLEVSKETTLRQSLSAMREALDHYYGDTGRYPDSIEQLVE